MLQSVAARTFAPILLRFALAAVFVYHGLEKVHADNSYGFAWMKPPPADVAKPPETPPASAAPRLLPGVLQLAVAWGELLGGAACALGLFTRVAAVGLAGIMIGAIVTVTGQHGFSMLKSGFEYNLVLILVAGSLMLLGPGPVSLDRVIKVKMRGPATY